MPLNVSMSNGVLIIKPEGKLDAVTSDVFNSEAAQHLEPRLSVVLDMSDVEYMSSAGLRSILLLAKKTDSEGGSFRLAGLRGTVEDVFNISGFSKIMETYSSVSEAIQAIPQ